VRVDRCRVIDLAREGLFGRDFRGGGQCDAFDFAFEVMQVLEAGEGAVFEGMIEDVFGDAGRRAVMDEYVWGMVVRTRARCALCPAVSDHLKRRMYLELALEEGAGASLADLWNRAASEGRGEGQRCPVDCGGLGFHQNFVEKEPAVLVKTQSSTIHRTTLPLAASLRCSTIPQVRQGRPRTLL
jgi:hypothetical protein